MKSLIKAFIRTCVAIPLMLLLVLNPFEHEADVAMSDFYIRTARRMSLPQVHPDILLLGVDSLSRVEIAEVTELVDFLGAKVVALDVFMNNRSPYDGETLSALASCENLVLPSSLTGADKGSIFTSIPGARYGYVNFDSVKEGGVVRQYTPSRDGKQSFADVICHNEKEQGGLIRYDGVEFDVITPDEISAEKVAGKTILIGNFNDFSDCHQTPIGVLPGVLVHAYTVRTIMDGCQPRPLPLWVQLLFTLVIGTVVLWAHAVISAKDGDLGNLCSRIGQIILLVVLYFIGAALFVRNGIYADLSLPMLLVAAVLLFYDIIMGAKAVWRLIKEHKKA